MMKYSMKIYLFLCFGSVVSLNNKHNVLLIIVDDLRPLTDENIILPNIEKLAYMGVTFKNAFAQQALCAPSRNSMLTGRSPDSLHLYDFYSYWRDSVGNYTTIPQYFKENGYETYSVGKVFHPGKSSDYNDDYPYSWSHIPFHPSTEVYKNSAVCKNSNNDDLEKDLICPVDVDIQPNRTLPDIQSVDYAVEILKSRRKNSKPLFLAIGFHKPHIPLKFPREFLDLIPMNMVHLPKERYFSDSIPLVASHPWADVRRRDDIRKLDIPFPLGVMPEDWTLKIRQSYYATAMYIDSLIGVLMNNVDLRKTIVVLTSDHGWSLGENGLWAKYSNFDTATRVPLIILAPNLQQKIIDTPVELLDLFPTLVHLAELTSIPQCENSSTELCVEGNNLFGVHKTDFAISQYPRPSVFPQKNSDKPKLKHIKIMGYSIRTQRFRYTEWVAFNSRTFKMNWNMTYGFELYDHIVDPYESRNVVLNSKYAKLINYLSSLLKSNVDPNYSCLLR